ncbi:MAG: hypothetical protein M5R36_05470 [Deltaproteobacteria bacterium]|nr:hypothetical protein [Deltaproteobacteria bacterium]
MIVVAHVVVEDIVIRKTVVVEIVVDGVVIGDGIVVTRIRIVVGDRTGAGRIIVVIAATACDQGIRGQTKKCGERHEITHARLQVYRYYLRSPSEEKDTAAGFRAKRKTEVTGQPARRPRRCRRPAIRAGLPLPVETRSKRRRPFRS